uniref:Enkurin domain-containing protein n=1 Tax=Glossina brevipalpis TaxID=37001 RepID=A0A1A9WR37_9MUSC
MAAKTSSSSLRTLNGLFDLPKTNHRRDFLRENKLSLKELQRSTANKLMQTKHEKEKKLQQLHPKVQKQQEQRVTCGSSSRNKAALENKGNMKGEAQFEPRQQSTKRSYSFHRALAKHANYSHDNDKCCLNPASSVTCPRNGSATSVVSKIASCEKGIQTEDICDEEFLYEALRKCSSDDVKGKKKSYTNSTYAKQHRNYENDRLSQLEYNDNICNNNDNQNKDEDDQPPDDSCQRNLHKFGNVSKHMMRTQMSNSPPNGYKKKTQYSEEDDDLDEHIRSLNIEQNNATEAEELSSGRSHQTARSQVVKKKCIGGVHKFGSRDSIRLPRYLQKEKQEREEERLKEMSRDINCPLGHYALTEEERVISLNNAQKKMASLVQELNHMPMTTETLRIRNRKMQIEKELTKIEFDIRLYSKPKVYVPLPADQS